MNNNEMKAAMNQMEQEFLNLIVHQEGGRILRSSLRNVDCQMAGEKCVVFLNKDNKFLVVVLFSETGFVYANPITFLGRNFPARNDVATHLMPDIIDWLIKKSEYSDTDKNDMNAYISTWISERAMEPDNQKKMADYNALKVELQQKGLI